MRKKYAILILIIAVAMSGCGINKTDKSANSSVISDTSSLTESPDLAAGSTSSLNTSSQPNDTDLTIDSDWELMNNTSKIINELTSSDEYKNASIEERYELASKLLTQLQEDGYIKNLYYSEDSLFSFTYKNGVLGGLYLKDFGTKIGEIPIN